MAVVLPRIDSSGVVLVDAACVGVRAWAIVSVRSSASGGIFGRGQLISLISDEVDINSVLWGLELIYVPYRHTCGPAERKDHSRERVSSSYLESPLVHDCL